MGQPGVSDLALAGPLLNPYFLEWANPLPSTPSDHILILLPFEALLFRAPPPKPNCALTDWPPVDNALKFLTIPTPPRSRPLIPLGFGSTTISRGSHAHKPFTPLSSASPTGQSHGGH